MAESRRSSSSGCHQRTVTAAAGPSRLQRRRPASLQISPSSWNAAIPLLSPLCASPTAADMNNVGRLSSSSRVVDPTATAEAAGEKQQPVVFKKWQHPAAPFCNEQTGGGSFAPSFFVPV